MAEHAASAEVYVRRLASKKEATRGIAAVFGVRPEEVYRTDKDSGPHLFPDDAVIWLNYSDNRLREDRYPLWLQVVVFEDERGWDAERVGALAQVMDAEVLVMFGSPQRYVVGVPSGATVDVVLVRGEYLDRRMVLTEESKAAVEMMQRREV